MKAKIREKYPIGLVDKYLFEILNSANQKKKNPLVIIQGGYGKRNTGDDALLLVIRQKILSKLPNARIVALCHFPEEVRERYGIEAYYFFCKNAFAVLSKADLLIIGGGGIVNRINTFSGFHFFKIFDPKGKYLFLTTILQKIRRKPVIFYMVGMTSIPDFVVKLLMKVVLPHVDLLSVRDHLSVRLIKQLGIKTVIHLAHDPALDLKSVSQDRIERILKQENILSNKFKLGMNIRYVQDEEINKRIIDEIIKAIIKISKADVEIIFIPIGRHQEKKIENDYLLGKKIESVLLKENISLKVIEGLYSPAEIKAILGSMDMLFLARLHAVILSCEYNIPTTILAYDDKVKQFGLMLDKAQDIIDWEAITAEKLVNCFESKFKVKILK